MRIPVLFLILLAMQMFNSFEAHSSHMAGGFIRYESTGVPHQYRIILTLYRDCNGINLNIDPVVYLRNECSSFISNATLSFDQTTGLPVPQLCTNSPSTCEGGNRYGLQKYVWTGVVNFPFAAGNTGCNRWTITWGSDAVDGFPARNNSNTILNSGNTNFFIDAYLDDNVPQYQTAPLFSDSLIPAYCINQNVNINFNVQDPDGDSIVFSLVPALSAFETAVQYENGYSASVPAVVSSGGMSINQSNGNITFSTSLPQLTVFVLKMEKYRNGTIIGYVKFDVQVVLGIFPYCQAVYNSVQLEGCLYVQLPGGRVYQSGNYLDTFYAANCQDSIVTYSVTIKQPTSSYNQDTACDQYFWNGQLISQSGRFTQVLRNAVDCDSIVELELLIEQTPNKPLAFDTFVCARSYLPLPYPGAMQGRLDWYRDSSLTQFLGSGIILPYEIERDTNYLFLVFRSPSGCTSPVARVSVVNDDEELKRSLPTAFTPNSDNTNDVWEVSWIFPLELKVFDRWGLLVWKDEGTTVKWDGGNRSPGAYPYILSHTGCTGRMKYKYGIIHLVR